MVEKSVEKKILKNYFSHKRKNRIGHLSDHTMFAPKFASAETFGHQNMDFVT